MNRDHELFVVDLARRISSDLTEFATPTPVEPSGEVASGTAPEGPALTPSEELLVAFDARVVDEDLRLATRSRYVSTHYADAVEAAVKVLNECIRSRSGRSDDGDALMTAVFSPSHPILRINKGRSKSDESEQRGHMQLCQGVVSAWRNPRAHTLRDDEPRRALMMLETINDLIMVTKSATRTRKRR